MTLWGLNPAEHDPQTMWKTVRLRLRLPLRRSAARSSQDASEASYHSQSTSPGGQVERGNYRCTKKAEIKWQIPVGTQISTLYDVFQFI